MNKYKFLKLLEKKLNDMSFEDVNNTINFYKNDIETRYKNGEKQKDIINSYGDIDILCNKIVNEKKKKKRFNLFKKRKCNDRLIKANKTNITISIIFFIIIFLLTLVSVVVFVTASFCYLDGVNVIGLVLFTLFMVIFNVILLNLLDKFLINKEINITSYLKYLIVLVVLIIASATLAICEFYRIDYKSDVNEKYSTTRVVETVKMSTSKTSITFNSNYNTTYSVKYSTEFEDEIRIEVKYYDVIYDYNMVKEVGKVYISFHKPVRDVISFYIDNLRDNNIYNINELERYSITIFVNEKDKDRFVIEREI